LPDFRKLGIEDFLTKYEELAAADQSTSTTRSAVA
jgi:hypothetical protein